MSSEESFFVSPDVQKSLDLYCRGFQKDKEVILDELNPDNFEINSTKFHSATQAREEGEANMTWKAGTINLNNDNMIMSKGKLSKEQLHGLRTMFKFFSVSDKVVGELISEISSDCKCNAVNGYYQWQSYNELHHHEAYQNIVKVLYPNVNFRVIYDELVKVKAIQDKIAWAQFWCRKEMPISIKLAALVIMEIVMFCSSFGNIASFKTSEVIREIEKLEGIIFTNDYITRDEEFHGLTTSKFIREYIVQKVPHDIIKYMIKTAVEHEIEFSDEVFSQGYYNSITRDNMIKFIQLHGNVAYHLITDDKTVLYVDAKNNFDFYSTSKRLNILQFETQNPDYVMVTKQAEIAFDDVIDTDDLNPFD